MHFLYDELSIRSTGSFRCPGRIPRLSRGNLPPSSGTAAQLTSGRETVLHGGDGGEGAVAEARAPP